MDIGVLGPAENDFDAVKALAAGMTQERYHLVVQALVDTFAGRLRTVVYLVPRPAKTPDLAAITIFLW